MPGDGDADLDDDPDAEGVNMEIKFRMNRWEINIKGARLDEFGEPSKSLPDDFGSARPSPRAGGRGPSNARASLNEPA